MALKRITSPDRWGDAFISFSSRHIPSAVSQPHLSIFPLLAPNPSKCLCFSITPEKKKKTLFLPQAGRLFFCCFILMPVGSRKMSMKGTSPDSAKATLIYIARELPGANSIVCWRPNVTSEVIKGNTPALGEERPCQAGNGVIWNRKFNSISSHLWSESRANRTPFLPELRIPCPLPLQSKGKSRTFLHVLQVYPGFAVRMSMGPQKPGRD